MIGETLIVKLVAKASFQTAWGNLGPGKIEKTLKELLNPSFSSFPSVNN